MKYNFLSMSELDHLVRAPDTELKVRRRALTELESRESNFMFLCERSQRGSQYGQYVVGGPV